MKFVISTAVLNSNCLTFLSNILNFFIASFISLLPYLNLYMDKFMHGFFGGPGGLEHIQEICF